MHAGICAGGRPKGRSLPQSRWGVARGGGLELLSGLSRSVPAGSELAATVRFLVSADPASEVLVATSLGTFVITL